MTWRRSGRLRSACRCSMRAIFSLGAAVMRWLTAEAARRLPAEQFDLEIVETHHRRKADAPSGTALAIGEAAASARGLDFDAHALFGRPRQDGARPVGAIGFSAVRGGGAVGEHSALFLGGVRRAGSPPQGQ